MGTASTESLYPPLTADLIQRAASSGLRITLRRKPRPRKPMFGDNVRLFAATWAGGFVFFITFLG